ncbi:hypothetical protein [Humisphaera borealis]|uniref:Uncharacterized protein n=1 Tax=Humisphaera borealis TaxID=2807512 RepID=A0A7M2WQP1_9BACT|nr:hypothetical protein [Humisphaera borealis]QOV87554.1 hypothetical protein IPV69_14780 [Humisphaera borealis]
MGKLTVHDGQDQTGEIIIDNADEVVKNPDVGLHRRGMIFMARWKPPKGGDWSNKDETCKPCEKVVFIQKIRWGGGDWQWDWGDDDYSQHGGKSRNPLTGSDFAQVYDEPNIAAISLLEYYFRGMRFSAITHAKCVKGRDMGVIYAEIRWGFSVDAKGGLKLSDIYIGGEDRSDTREIPK